MTLRQLLTTVHLPTVYLLINKKDCSANVKKTDPTLEQTTAAYERVVAELLSKPKVRKHSMPICVKMAESWYDKHKYPEVCFFNPRYEAPRKGLKPWGGKNPPKGHYNCNLYKHNQWFAMGFTPWSKIIDTPIVNQDGFSNEQTLAEILWELTFYGWTEKKTKIATDKISKSISKAKKEIKKGKCIELPVKEGDLKIILPDSVRKQLEDISKQNDQN